jgi:hypothetical protein
MLFLSLTDLFEPWPDKQDEAQRTHSPRRR